MSAFLVGLALLAASPSAPATTPHSEFVERGRFKNEVSKFLLNRNVAELESLGRRLIWEDPRYRSGISMLVDFYFAFEPMDNERGPASPEDRRATFEKWAEIAPGSHWPKVGMAVVEFSLARKVRGERVARETTPEQLAGHREHVERALKWAKKAMADRPHDPELYALLLRLCQRSGCPREDADALVANAIKINPTYDGIYSTMANYLLPQWNGSADELVEFGEKAADGNEAVGDIAYVRVATVALMSAQDKLRSDFPRLSWNRIRTGLKKIEDKYPGSSRTSYLLARFAEVYGDREAAHKAFEKLGDTFGPDAQQYWKGEARFLKARNWALSATAGTP